MLSHFYCELSHIAGERGEISFVELLNQCNKTELKIFIRHESDDVLVPATLIAVTEENLFDGTCKVSCKVTEDLEWNATLYLQYFSDGEHIAWGVMKVDIVGARHEMDIPAWMRDLPFADNIFRDRVGAK